MFPQEWILYIHDNFDQSMGWVKITRTCKLENSTIIIVVNYCNCSFPFLILSDSSVALQSGTKKQEQVEPPPPVVDEDVTTGKAIVEEQSAKLEQLSEYPLDLEERVQKRKYH